MRQVIRSVKVHYPAVDEGFIRHAMTALVQGADAVQGLVQPLSGGSPSADLAAYSEILAQRIDDVARVRLGWPIPLRGTGMAFRREVLESLLPCLRTRVEDIEMSLLLAAQGKRARFLREAVVGDPKPANTRGVAAQRARWLQGQREVLRRHGRLVPPEDVQALADALRDLIQDPAARRAMGDAARQKAQAYDARQMVARTLQVYERVLR